MTMIFLFLDFFRIGLFSVGGGLAILPFLIELTSKYEWLTEEMIGNYLAIAQSVPGAIGINMAAQIGFEYASLAGAFIASLGLTAPSIIIIIIVARMFTKFKENKTVAAVFNGMRPAGVGLLSAAAFSILKICLWNSSGGIWFEAIRWREFLIIAVLFLLVWKLKKHPVIYILFAAALGIIFGL